VWSVEVKSLRIVFDLSCQLFAIVAAGNLKAELLFSCYLVLFFGSIV